MPLGYTTSFLMNKLILILSYDDPYFLPVKNEKIESGLESKNAISMVRAIFLQGQV